MHELGSWPDLYSGICVTLGCSAAATSCALWGRLICGPALALELAVVAGWGVLCLIGTLLGCLAPEAHGVRLAVDIWIGGGAALLALCVLSWSSRGRLARSLGPAWFSTGDAILVWRVGVVALPLLVTVWGIGPGLVDSYTHWIPNLVYLADLGTFPRSPGEAPLSSFPAFPYGLQMLAYAAVRVGGRTPPFPNPDQQRQDQQQQLGRRLNESDQHRAEDLPRPLHVPVGECHHPVFGGGQMGVNVKTPDDAG